MPKTTKPPRDASSLFDEKWPFADMTREEALDEEQERFEAERDLAEWMAISDPQEQRERLSKPAPTPPAASSPEPVWRFPYEALGNTPGRSNH